MLVLLRLPLLEGELYRWLFLLEGERARRDAHVVLTCLEARDPGFAEADLRDAAASCCPEAADVAHRLRAAAAGDGCEVLALDHGLVTGRDRVGVGHARACLCDEAAGESTRGEEGG